MVISDIVLYPIQGVCLAVVTGSLHYMYSTLKPRKYQTLSWQVSNADGLEQATAFPF